MMAETLAHVAHRVVCATNLCCMGEATMPNVTIYRFKTPDPLNDDKRLSRRWGTLEGIEFLKGEVLDHTATEVDARFVGCEISGLTERDFEPGDALCTPLGFDPMLRLRTPQNGRQGNS